jgi:hypothetical protein
VDDEDFEHLGKDEVLARIAAADGASAPLTMTTSDPAAATHATPPTVSGQAGAASAVTPSWARNSSWS